jgi:hypothetical protein
VANLIYTAISSVDGYVADAEGNFEWSASDEEVHRFVNDLERPIGTNLSGRRMCEVMRYWEKAPTGDAGPSAEQEYAKIRQTADKIVYSKILAPSWWEQAIRPCRTMSGWCLSCWTSADSATAWSICTTASGCDLITTPSHRW